MPYAAARTATRVEDAGRYQRHRPDGSVQSDALAIYNTMSFMKNGGPRRT